MIRVRFHRVGGEVLLAACDSELFGRCLEDESGLSLRLKGSFYEGDEVNEEEFAGMLAQVTSANLVGERTVRIAKEKNLISKDGVLVIAGVPHALLFYM
jgi:hypothetical protein